MTVVLVLLSGIIFGAINVAFFIVGYHLGIKKPNPDAVVVDKTNMEAVEDLMKWMNYRG